ncbi:30S ribosomal protein S9 [candidate division TA06 bacterium]|uniref:Small ribosomal subunit protein uS9 n=1 Tax=candidate division TA06 bacterium TaxID=2250710 RepID=A0A523XES8_UNCT6|nr:MAG: 30S ribosomal protein S9 [candidate division TA06 bacterium]
MAELYYDSLGRRKESVARVRLVLGKGKNTVNGRSLKDYFGRDSLVALVERPLRLTENLDKFDVKADAAGGGVSGQAGAVQLGISKALIAFDETLRSDLKAAGLVTRDPRRKEREKYGLAKRRKRYQFSKR